MLVSGDGLESKDLKTQQNNPLFFFDFLLMKANTSYIDCPIVKNLQIIYLKLYSEKTFHVIVCDEAVSLHVSLE